MKNKQTKRPAVTYTEHAQGKSIQHACVITMYEYPAVELATPTPSVPPVMATSSVAFCFHPATFQKKNEQKKKLHSQYCNCVVVEERALSAPCSITCFIFPGSCKLQGHLLCPLLCPLLYIMWYVVVNHLPCPLLYIMWYVVVNCSQFSLFTP